jgi:drug/metabolite transporter (DMT)-like permease
MKELTIGTLIAVFEEMFGRWLFWGLVAGAVIVTLLYLYVLIRDRQVSWRKFLIAQLSMPVGAVAAVVFVQQITHSHFRDLGGPVDWLVFLGVAVLGAVGLAVLVYTAQSLIRPPARNTEAAGRVSGQLRQT